jgi:hypothetical protein
MPGPGQGMKVICLSPDTVRTSTPKTPADR